MLYTKEEMGLAAKFIIEKMGTSKVAAFTATMGAGKTTLISEICKQLEVIDIPSSPTFSIINEYATKKGEKIYHLDLYRVKDLEEALQAGVEEVLYSNCFCFVEWPQVVESILPLNTFFVDITIQDLDKRTIHYHSEK